MIPQPHESAEIRCWRRAGIQHGLLTLHQAMEEGMSQDAVQRSVKAGKWRRIFPRVLSVTPGNLSYVQMLQAAILWAGEGSAISHRSAAALLGLDGSRPSLIEISVTRRSRAPMPDLVVPRS